MKFEVEFKAELEPDCWAELEGIKLAAGADFFTDVYKFSLVEKCNSGKFLLQNCADSKIYVFMKMTSK